MAAVAALSNNSNNTNNSNNGPDDDVVCTPDFPLEPLCEVNNEYTNTLYLCGNIIIIDKK